jgi:hypothetical protein
MLERLQNACLLQCFSPCILLYATQNNAHKNMTKVKDKITVLQICAGVWNNDLGNSSATNSDAFK